MPKDKNQGKQKVSRRRFLKAAGALSASGAVLGIAGIIYSLKEEEVYAEWYKRNFKDVDNERIFHPSLAREISPSEEETTFLLNETEKKLGRKFQIEESRFYKGQTFLPLNLNEDSFKEYIFRSERRISEFFSFIGLEDRLLEIEYHNLAITTKLEHPSENKIPLYITFKFFSTALIGKYKAKIDKRSVTIIGKEEDDLGGEIRLESTYRVDKEKIELISHKVHPILISADISAIQSYTSPPAETLHYILRKPTYKSVERDVNDFWIKLGKPDILPKNFFDETTWEGMRREEGVVHAALHLFVESKEKEIGLSIDEIKANNSDYTKDVYRYIPYVRKLMEAEGCKKIVKKYLENPRLIFP